MSEQERPSTPFHDLSEYIALPRLAGLVLSPDGTRLITTVSTLSADQKKYCSALWEIDSSGQRPARRLTRSAPGEAAPAFLPDGSVLFTSRRPDPDAAEGTDEVAALWLLPSRGEARQVATRPGGIDGVLVAADSGAVFFTSPTLPGTTTAEEDEQARKERKDAGIAAILHERYPVRFWDHDLGPARTRVLAAGAAGPDDGGLAQFRDLTPEPADRPAVEFAGLAVSRDGSMLAAGWEADDEPASLRTCIVLIDTSTGRRRELANTPGVDFSAPAFAPDGQTLACVRTEHGTFEEPPTSTLWLLDVRTGAGRDLLPTSELRPGQPVFTEDGSAVLFTADERGHHPVFRLDVGSGQLTRLTASGAYTDLQVSRDGVAVYALRDAVDAAPTPVRLDPNTPDQQPVRLPAPPCPALPGHLTEVTTTTADGTELRAWLALPESASASSPAPLLLWIHGGPLASWNSWTWRWNPWLMTARGYAVLLPDPALSTGYGQEFLRRGWGRWGDPTFGDLMAITDVTCARADIDHTRTAAMGGSFGGYMANWVATHTDRFRAIVTHASLWNLDNFAGTTDLSSYWQREFGDPLTQPERYEQNSPHRHADKITSPMLVIHGDKDYRVPIGEALRLWYDLMSRAVDAKFLYFPNENHWVLTPGHAKLWYETVFAFLATHVLDEKWERPPLL